MKIFSSINILMVSLNPKIFNFITSLELKATSSSNIKRKHKVKPRFN